MKKEDRIWFKRWKAGMVKYEELPYRVRRLIEWMYSSKDMRK